MDLNHRRAADLTPPIRFRIRLGTSGLARTGERALVHRFGILYESRTAAPSALENEKAACAAAWTPRGGLEPPTRRLTAGCSAC